METLNVIVTAVGAPGAPDIIGLLRKDPRLRLIGMDMNEQVAGRYLVDTFVRNLPGSSPEFIDHVLRTAVEHDVRVVFPLSTDELLAFSKAKDRFERQGIGVCVSDDETIRIANDKAALYRYFAGEDFVPGFETPADRGALEGCIRRLGYPERDVCVKPYVSHGSRGFRVITADLRKTGYSVGARPYNPFISLEAFLRSFESSWQPVFFSEYLPGQEWGIDMFVDPVSGERLIATRNNGDVQSSAITFGRLEKNEALIDIGNRIADRLKFSYIINIDIKYDVHNRPKIIEINPRVPATIHLLSEAGNNLPLISVRRAAGQDCRLSPVEYGKTVYFYKQSMVI